MSEMVTIASMVGQIYLKASVRNVLQVPYANHIVILQYIPVIFFREGQFKSWEHFHKRKQAVGE